VATKDLWATVAPVDLVVGRDGRQYKRVGLTVNITGSGIGVIVSDSSTGQLVVSGFREMPNGMPNPSLYSKLISAGSVSSKLAKVDAKNPQQVSAPSWKKGKDILGYRYYIIMFAN
jgi:hypothetical protein